MPYPPLAEDALLSLLIHSPSKAGKSTLASTAPLPMLVLDVEGSWRFIRTAGFKGAPLRIKYWKPMSEACPQWDGTWDVVVATVRDYGTMEMVYRHLTQRPHQFVTVVVDSVTEVQRRCRTNLKGTEQMQIQDWGVLLTQMDGLVRGYRDLTLDDSSVRCVIFVSETKMRDVQWRPYAQGQLADSMPYWLDVLGWLTTIFTDDANGQPTVKRKVLRIGSGNPQFYAGERVQGLLPDDILDPNVTQMINAVFPPPTPTTTPTAALIPADTISEKEGE